MMEIMVRVTQYPSLKVNNHLSFIRLECDSLCRYLGRTIRSKLSGKCCLPGDSIRIIAHCTDGLVDSSNVVCIITGGNGTCRRRGKELSK